jgi:hypothetical protein
MARKTILSSFVRHPEEAAIIGRLIAGYGELEFDLAFCVRWIIDDEDTAFKVMYRAPGEMQRILMADALARTKLPQGRGRTTFEQIVASMHHCRKIRNQYAHCHWYEYADGTLVFINLEEIAAQHDAVVISSVTQRVPTLDLLREQESFFVNVRDRMAWLICEAQVWAGIQKSNPYALPRVAKLPAMYL